MDKYTTLKALMKQGNSNKYREYKKGGEKKYTQHKVNVFIWKKLKKAFKRRKKCKQELDSFEEMDT